MYYNWKYVSINSQRAFSIWKRWPSYAKIQFLEFLKEDYSNDLRSFCNWCIERIDCDEFLGIERQVGLNQINTWIRIMNHLCDENAYNMTLTITQLLEDFRVQTVFNQLQDSWISSGLRGKIIDNNHKDIESMFKPELEKRFNYIFENEEFEIYVIPSKVSYDLGIGPFFGTDIDTWEPVKEWSYRAWIFCTDNNIIK